MCASRKEGSRVTTKPQALTKAKCKISKWLHNLVNLIGTKWFSIFELTYQWIFKVAIYSMCIFWFFFVHLFIRVQIWFSRKFPPTPPNVDHILILYIVLHLFLFLHIDLISQTKMRSLINLRILYEWHTFVIIWHSRMCWVYLMWNMMDHGDYVSIILIWIKPCHTILN